MIRPEPNQATPRYAGVSTVLIGLIIIGVGVTGPA